MLNLEEFINKLDSEEASCGKTTFTRKYLQRGYRYGLQKTDSL
jgi:hypothetical protein